MEKDFRIFAATCPPKIYTGEEDEQYLIKAVDFEEATQLFKEEMHRMQKSDQYDFVFLEISFDLRRQYEAAVQNGDICDYFAETDGNGIVKTTKSELEIIKNFYRMATNENLSDYDDNEKEL